MVRRRLWQAAASASIGTGTAVLLGMLLPGTLVSFYYGDVNRDVTLRFFAVCGMLLVWIGSLVVSAIYSNSQRHIIRSGRDFGVVITPAGMAVCQRKSFFEFRWKQVREVRLIHGGSLFAPSADEYAAGIELHVAGLPRVKILDLYDRPLTAIHERIMQNWQKPIQ